MRLILTAAVAFLFAIPGSQVQVAPESAKKRFTSPDGVFRFEYSATLVSCKRDSSQSDRWTPDESCEAFTPVCSDVSGNSGDTVACIAYPANRIRKGTSFQAAAFSVNRLDEARTDSECFRVPQPPPRVGTSHTETINGVKFGVTEIDGVATGNLITGYVYRAFHGNACYELGIRIAFSNPVNADPRAVKNFDLESVHRRLKKVLETFTFLN